MPVVAARAAALAPLCARAQFGSGIVFDPTQSTHAAQQILQGNQLYTTTVETTRNVIGAYNLAQRMANLPQNYYTAYSNLGRQQWFTLEHPRQHLRELPALDKLRHNRLRSCFRGAEF